MGGRDREMRDVKIRGRRGTEVRTVYRKPAIRAAGQPYMQPHRIAGSGAPSSAPIRHHAPPSEDCDVGDVAQDEENVDSSLDVGESTPSAAVGSAACVSGSYGDASISPHVSIPKLESLQSESNARGSSLGGSTG